MSNKNKSHWWKTKRPRKFDLTPEALAAAKEEFFARGGKVKKIDLTKHPEEEYRRYGDAFQHISLGDS